MRQDDDHRHGRQVVSALNVHLVFVTKYRRRVQTGEHLDAFQEVFTSVRADFDAELVGMDGEDDHVRLLVGYPPNVAVARLVNSLKGVSARRLRQRYRVRPTGSTCGPRRTSPHRPMAPHWRRSGGASASSASEPGPG
jgi:putative transposase